MWHRNSVSAGYKAHHAYRYVCADVQSAHKPQIYLKIDFKNI